MREAVSFIATRAREFLISLWRGRVCQLTKGEKKTRAKEREKDERTNERERGEEALMENVFALTTVEKKKGVERAKTAGGHTSRGCVKGWTLAPVRCPLDMLARPYGFYIRTLSFNF